MDKYNYKVLCKIGNRKYTIKFYTFSQVQNFEDLIDSMDNTKILKIKNLTRPCWLVRKFYEITNFDIKKGIYE